MTTTRTRTVVADEVRRRACAPWSAIVRAGQTLRIIDLDGNQAVDCLLYGVAGDQSIRCATARRPPSPRSATSS